MKKNNVLVTILITNFNKQNYIEDTINSCIKQSYKNIEIIIIDNCSTDNSFKLISKYKNIKIIMNKVRKKSSALNQIRSIEIGTLKSRGKLICLLDGDDMFKKDKIKKIVKSFNKHIKISAICDVPIIYNTHACNDKFFYNKKRFYKSNIWPNTFPTSSISLKKEYLLDCIDLFKKDKYPLLEIDFRICCLLPLHQNSFLILNKNLTFYRQVNDGIMSKYKKFRKSWWIKRNEAFNFFKFIKKSHKNEFNYGLDYTVTKIIAFFFQKS
jgi:glycosyltransferase involved in cell wall biosynthesis